MEKIYKIAYFINCLRYSFIRKHFVKTKGEIKDQSSNLIK